MRETMVMHTDPANAKPQRSDRKFLLSEMLGAKVFLHEKKIGSLSDLMIVETGKLPEVRNFVISRPFGDPSLLIPWERMVTLEPQQLVIDIDDLKKFESSPPEDAILLRDHILDKKVLDTEDAEVEVVYDIRLVERNAKLYVTEVDTSKSARLRRLGFGFLSGVLAPAGRSKGQWFDLVDVYPAAPVAYQQFQRRCQTQDPQRDPGRNSPG